MKSEEVTRIVVLGVGNVLLKDEGVGVVVLNHLEAAYEFPPNVRLVDGGVLGLALTGTFMDADQVIVIDAVRGGQEPGALYRFVWESKPEHIAYKDSLHQINLMEVMATLPLVCDPPEVVIIGVEFADIDDWGLELTPQVAGVVTRMMELVVEELTQMGYPPRKREEPLKVHDVFSGPRQDN